MFRPIAHAKGGLEGEGCTLLVSARLFMVVKVSPPDRLHADVSAYEAVGIFAGEGCGGEGMAAGLVDDEVAPRLKSAGNLMKEIA